MDFYEDSYKVKFINSKENKIVTLKTLAGCIINFLEHFGEENIVGKEFCSIIGRGDGETKFSRLLEASGYKDNAGGFFSEILKKLEKTNSDKVIPVKAGNIELPYLMSLSILEILIPGNNFITIKNPKQLERLANINVPDDKIADLQKVIDVYPVRLSMHTIRQMRLSPAVAYQYMPFVEELDPAGLVHTWIGQFHRGIVEQMYENRVIFLLNMGCPVYCRFCFRKHKECRNQKSPVKKDVKEAVDYIRNNPHVKEIVLTGGDPFMNRATLTCAIEGLKEIDHVQSLRVATRGVAYYPELFYNDNSFWLNYIKTKNLELRQKGKKIELATHFIHPDEVSTDSLYIISELVKNGIPVYIQTPYLKDCNDTGRELVQLFNLLRGAGAEIHYIYIPCSPIRGNSIYWTPISSGINTAAYLRANLTDRAMPSIVTATAIGKMDWNSSGWAVEPVSEDKKYFWIRTPYTRKYYESFTPGLKLADFVRDNQEGTLDIKYMADIGDENLFLGSRELKGSKEVDGMVRDIKAVYQKLKSDAVRDGRIKKSVVPTGSSTLFRIHKTRVELDINAEEEELKYNLEYIKKEHDITDIILSSEKDITAFLYRTGEIIKELHNINHVNAIRLRSLNFNYEPEVYTRAVINKLGNLNRLTVTNPKKLEIETYFLHSHEFKEVHREISDLLIRKGITVYNNTPLLSLVNDTPEEILNISYKCREMGIEFHHLYLSGLPIQKDWNEQYPVDIFKITDIATLLRRHGSGRELPAYIILTELGEVDYGLTSKFIETGEKGKIFLKLLPYSIEYYKNIYPSYSWPEGVKEDDDGKPIIIVRGLR